MEEMGKKTVSLDRLKPGEKGWIKELLLEERTGRKLEDMGFQRGRPVECAYQSPWGDPAAYYVMGALVAIRRGEAGRIQVEIESGIENGVK